MYNSDKARGNDAKVQAKILYSQTAVWVLNTNAKFNVP